MSTAAALLASSETIEALLGSCETAELWILSCRLCTISRATQAAVQALRAQMHAACLQEDLCVLDGRRALRVLTRDCKALRKLNLGLCDTYDDTVDAALRANPALEDLELEASPEKLNTTTLFTIAAHCLRLQRVTIHAFGSSDLSGGLQAIAAGCRCLTELCFRTRTMTEDVVRCIATCNSARLRKLWLHVGKMTITYAGFAGTTWPALEELNLTGNVGPGGPFAHLCSATMPALKSLDAKCNDWTGLERVESTFPKLKSFKLQGGGHCELHKMCAPNLETLLLCYGVDLSTLEHGFADSALRSLKYLFVHDGVVNLTSAGALSLVKAAPLLEELELSDGEAAVDDALLERLPQLCPRLRDLELSNTACTIRGISALAGLPLQRLSALLSPKPLCDEDLWAISSHLPLLRTLNACIFEHEETTITLAGVQALIARMEHLEAVFEDGDRDWEMFWYFVEDDAVQAARRRVAEQCKATLAARMRARLRLEEAQAAA